MTSKTMAKRVERGIALLNARTTDWARRVDLLTLDMGSRDHSLLDQLFPSFHHGLDLLKISMHVACKYGFDLMEQDEYLAPEKQIAKWRQLTDLWRQAIEAEV